MNLAGLLVGTAFGFLIAAARLHDYDVIHRMLLLQELDVFLLMGTAVGVAAPLIWLLRRRGWRTPLAGPLTVPSSRVERKHLLGAAVFGTGWAAAGTCPGPALAMTASGNLLGIPVMAGLVLGMLLRDRLQARSNIPEARGRLARVVDGERLRAAVPARSDDRAQTADGRSGI